jgi:hypothetical protein
MHHTGTQARAVLNATRELPAARITAARRSADKAATLAGILRLTAEALSPVVKATGRDIELDLLHHANSPAVGDDLREAIRALLETSLAVGAGPIRVRERIEAGPADKAFIRS